MDLLRNWRRKGTIDNGNGNTFGKWLQNGSAKRLGVVESTDHALRAVGLAVDDGIEEQKDALGIGASAKDDRIVGLLDGQRVLLSSARVREPFILDVWTDRTFLCATTFDPSSSLGFETEVILVSILLGEIWTGLGLIHSSRI